MEISKSVVTKIIYIRKSYRFRTTCGRINDAKMLNLRWTSCVILYDVWLVYDATREKQQHTSAPMSSFWSLSIIGMIDVCEHLMLRCRSNHAMSLWTGGVSHSSLQSMGHWSLQIALRMTPGSLLCLNAVIKLFPPQQEVKLRIRLHPTGGEYAEKSRSRDFDRHFHSLAT